MTTWAAAEGAFEPTMADKKGNLVKEHQLLSFCKFWSLSRS
jgi:hypothetical protein